MASIVLLGVAWPKEGRVSGAMGASGVSRYYTMSISELSYAFGEDPPPSQAYLDGEARAWREKLGRVTTVTDRWLAKERAAGSVAPVELGLATASPEDPSPIHAGGPLLRSTLVSLPRCSLQARNLGVTLRLALTTLPAPAARAALGKRYCAALAAENLDTTAPLALAFIDNLRADREGLALSLTGQFSVPVERLAAVTEARAAFFKEASLVMLRASRRFEAAHPGVTLHRPGSVPGHEQLVRFFMDTPIGGLDLLTDVVVASGAKAPSEVELKDALWREWGGAGLPVQVDLQSLLRGK